MHKKDNKMSIGILSHVRKKATWQWINQLDFIDTT